MTYTERSILSCKVGQLLHQSRWWKWRTDRTEPIYQYYRLIEVDKDLSPIWEIMPIDFVLPEEEFARNLDIDPYGYADIIEHAMEILLEIQKKHRVAIFLAIGSGGVVTIWASGGLDNAHGQGDTLPEAICHAIIEGFQRGILVPLEQE